MTEPRRRRSRGSGSERTGRLDVRPAQIVRRSNEQAETLHNALRVLYRDYIAAGGLDLLRESRRREHEPGQAKEVEPQ